MVAQKTRSSRSGGTRWPGARVALRLRRAHAHLALRAATAAGLAWLAVVPLPGVADRYPYYAPFGAVIAVSASVVASVRGSVQALVSILIGSGVAMAVMVLTMPRVLGLVLAVGLGTMMGAWHRLGPQGSWVPISAIFVMVIGQAHPEGFALAYLGLTGLGAGIGVLVNLVLPMSPITSAFHSSARVRAAIASETAALARSLEKPPDDDYQGWAERRRRFASLVEDVRREIREVIEARRGNWRTFHTGGDAQRHLDYARLLEQAALGVQQLVAALGPADPSAPYAPALSDRTRRNVGIALRSLSGVLDDTSDGETALREADQAVAALTAELCNEHRIDGESGLAAGAIASTFRQTVATCHRLRESQT